MSDRALALLERALDLTIRMHAKMHPRPDSPGFTRLDHFSGLFLERGAAEGQWMLQARTWGHPAPQSVHEWHVVAAGAAHQLDPTVTLPKRVGASAPETPSRPLDEPPTNASPRSAVTWRDFRSAATGGGDRAR